MAFEKGKSGNPTGRPKKLLPDGRSLSDIAKAYTETAIATLGELLTAEDTPAAAKISAATVLLDRGWGRATQSHEHTGQDGEPIKHVLGLTDEALAAIAVGRG